MFSGLRKPLLTGVFEMSQALAEIITARCVVFISGVDALIGDNTLPWIFRSQ